jgi:predicted membrane-bound spermidine synthase
VKFFQGKISLDQILTMFIIFNLVGHLSNSYVVIFFEYSADMLRPAAFLRDINQKKDFWKVTVKVRDNWTVVKDGREHIEMVIVDGKVFVVLKVYNINFYVSLIKS